MMTRYHKVYKQGIFSKQFKKTLKAGSQQDSCILAIKMFS